MLAQAILQWLTTHGLSPVDVQSQCYDGASNMSDTRSDCMSIVQQEAPLAMCFHCAAHHLNLAVEIYRDDLPHSVMLSTEYGMWIRKWKQHNRSEIPNKLVDALQACSALQFPNLHVLLQVALTLPVTSCESERSFSQLKLIKTSRRLTMSDSRLSGLALMKINHDRCNKLTSAEKMEELVKSFTQLHPRRMKLSFMLAD